MTKQNTIILLILGSVAVIALYFLTKESATTKNSAEGELTQKATSTPKNQDNPLIVYGVRVESPLAYQLVASPLTVRGTAPGTWFFEGSFPVKIEDGNGSLLASSPATSTADWMTTETIPFSSTLIFQKPSTATGTLILKNDNPSGDPSRDQIIRIPIRF